MITLHRVIKEAVQTGNSRQALLCVEFMRSRYNCTYEKCFNVFKALTGIRLDHFESLMEAAETAGINERGLSPEVIYDS